MKRDWRDKPKSDISLSDLTRREREVGELLAWGATKKEVANHLCISLLTVDIHARNIFEKTGCTKVNEFSAWWFCRRFSISASLSPIKRVFVSIVMLVLVSPAIFKSDIDGVRSLTRVSRIASARRGGRDVMEWAGENFE